MQIFHPTSCSVQRYAEEIGEVDRYRPYHCPQCEARNPLTGHGFYCRTRVDVAWEGIILVRRTCSDRVYYSGFIPTDPLLNKRQDSMVFYY